MNSEGDAFTPLLFVWSRIVFEFFLMFQRYYLNLSFKVFPLYI